ncbi:putative cation transporter [Erysiphe necator]|uniref:glutathione-specific gamma-glutamylcyclotransferase n=1 Tax=Uncinula necator TaxID=52586 RepID=A0A0B1PEC8_UNCNE|nr:putative cation transporter [Erysiphe necator]
MSSLSKNDESEFWLFGYGSFIWKPPPYFDKQIPGYVMGYLRRFWQVGVNLFTSMLKITYSFGLYMFPIYAYLPLISLHVSSEDHRGTPENPGRVVTLIERSFWNILDDIEPVPDEKVWGIAYHIEASKVAEVRECLDLREINGYSMKKILFNPKDTKETMQVFVYIGTPSNPQFTGPQQLESIAEIINKSTGISGSNREYLLCLEDALNRLSPPQSRDAHITKLANVIRGLDKNHK